MDWCFWIGTAVFLTTYLLIATEKVHKVICALGGAALMFIFVLSRPHGTGEALSGAAAQYAKLDAYARNVNFDVIFTLCGMMILVNILSTTGLFQYVAIKCAKLAKGSPLKMLILLFLCISCVEFLQVVFMTGSCDIDDLILNLSGAMLFYFVICRSGVSKILTKLTFGVWK